MENGKREELIESIFDLIRYWVKDPADYLNNEEDCENQLKDLLNQLAPSESQSVVDNEVSKKVCLCRPIGFFLNGTKCKSCGKIMCHQTD